MFFFFSVKNLALKQVVTASSIAFNGFAKYAVDGVYGKVECKNNWVHSHPSVPNSAWLRVDFGGWKHAQFVEIHNRIPTTNNNIKVRLSNTLIYVYGKDPSDDRRLCAKILDGNHERFYLPCLKTLYGKGIELHLPEEDVCCRILHICEIIVLGY